MPVWSGRDRLTLAVITSPVEARACRRAAVVASLPLEEHLPHFPRLSKLERARQNEPPLGVGSAMSDSFTSRRQAKHHARSR